MTKIRRTLFLALAMLVLSSIMPAQQSREVRKTVPLAKDGKVTIDTYKGSINVETWDKDQVDITAKIEADEWGKYSEDKVRDTEIDIDATASTVRIKTDYRKVERRDFSFWDLFDGDQGNLPLVRYDIRMPATASLRIKDYKSESTIKGLRSDVDFNTYKGSVDIVRLNGGLALETYKGDCHIEFEKMRSSSSIETYKGEIQVKMPSSASFEVDANVGRRGDFDSDFDLQSESGSRRHRDSSYRGQVNGGGPTLRMKTDKGNFKLVKQ